MAVKMLRAPCALRGPGKSKVRPDDEDGDQGHVVNRAAQQLVLKSVRVLIGRHGKVKGRID